MDEYDVFAFDTAIGIVLWLIETITSFINKIIKPPRDEQVNL